MAERLKVESVDEGSVGEELGILPGDIVTAFDGRACEDMLDYGYYDCMERFSMEVRRGEKLMEYEIEKEDWEQLGLNFTDDSYITPITCRNRCIFCFVDQLPPGMRETLYVKDDDYRLSFVSGNYVTLTNVGEKEKERIKRMKFSPMYVSVHATDEDVRLRMLGIKKAPAIMPLLKELTEAGITVHTQLVICPGINDGEILRKSLTDLYSLYPGVKSVAVVPVGLTGHRKNLNELRLNNKREAAELIDIADKFNKSIKTGNFVFCSDEIYVTAEKKEPPYDYYGDFDQIENGVGLMAKFRYEFDAALKDAVAPGKNSYTIVTGKSASELMEETLKAAKAKFPGLRANVAVVDNNFFGSDVTVAGLLTGKDVIDALKDADIGDVVLLPRAMLKEFEDVFLDGSTPEELAKLLNRRVEIIDGGYELVRAVAVTEEI